MGKSIVVVGAGGHGAVVAELAELCSYHVLGFVDDNPALHGLSVVGKTVLGSVADLITLAPDCVVLGIGTPRIRSRIYAELYATGVELPTLVHPSAVISSYAEIGDATVILECTVVKANVTIGSDVLVNSGAILGHDCHVADHCHISIGAKLAADVYVGEGAFLGAGAVAIPNVNVGAWSIVGAGAVVTSDLPSHVTAVGVPARVIKEHSTDT